MWTLYHDVQNNPIKDYVTISDTVDAVMDRAHVYSEHAWFTKKNIFFT